MNTERFEKESILLRQVGHNNIIFEHNSHELHYAASVTKVFYAAAISKMLTENEISDETIHITPPEVQAEGTNVLRDMLKDGNDNNLSVLVLMRLMLKYSCNASTEILYNKFFNDRKTAEKMMRQLGVKKSKLFDNNGKFVNKWNLDELTKIFEHLYSNPKEFGNAGKIARESLKESRGIYYLFDLLGVKILGSKTGTKIIDEGAQINNVGIIEVNNNQYICGAMVTRDNIIDSVKRIREIGKDMRDRINSN